MKFSIHSTSDKVPCGEWRVKKPDWDLSSLAMWHPEIVNDGREDNNEKWWFVQIEIVNLEDLLALSKKSKGEIIIDASDMSIEIYDEYRE